jgi:hypothetical protein
MRPLVLAVALVAAGCGKALVSLPSGSGSPVGANTANVAAAEATRACRSVQTMTAEVSVSGSTNGRRLRARLSVGVAQPASARLEAVSPFGPPLFIFVTAGSDASLLLAQDDRVLEHGAPSAVLDAVAGVPLDGADLVRTLTGCANAQTVESGRQFGDTWLVASAGDGFDLYLRRSKIGSPWTLAAVMRREAQSGTRWRAEFGARQFDVPQVIRLVSVDAEGESGKAFDLRLELSQIEVNTSLGSNVFTIQAPRTARPITLEELRASGPFGASGGAGRTDRNDR